MGVFRSLLLVYYGITSFKSLALNITITIFTRQVQFFAPKVPQTQKRLHTIQRDNSAKIGLVYRSSIKHSAE